MAKATLVTGLFKNRVAAEAAVDAILKRGYTRDDISVLMSDATRNKEFALQARTHAADGAGKVLQPEFHRQVVRRLVDYLQGVKVLDSAVGGLLEKGSGGAEERGADLGTGEDEEEEQCDERAENGRVELHARCESLAFTAFDVVQ